MQRGFQRWGDKENVYWLKHIQYSNPGEYRSDFNAYVNMNKVGNHLVFSRLKTNDYYWPAWQVIITGTRSY